MSSKTESSRRLVPSRACKRPRTTAGQPKVTKAPENSKGDFLGKPTNKNGGKTILILNDDCLLLIMAHVTTDDLLNLRLVHPRFKRLFMVQAKQAWKGLYVDRHFLAKNPLATHEDVYEAIGKGVKTLTMGLDKENDFLAVIKHFPLVTELSIDNAKLKDIKGISSFPRTVKILSMSIPDTTDAKYRTKLFEHFSPTLERMSYFQRTLKDLLPLRNLVELRIPINSVRNGLKEVLKNNPKLKYLTVSFLDHTTDSSTEDWTILANVKNLTRLEIFGLGETRIDFSRVPQFNFIDSLRVVIRGSWYFCVEALLDRMGVQMKTIDIEDEYEMIEEMDFFGHCAHLTQLETLFSGFQWWESDEECIRKACLLKSVKKLEFRIECPDATLEIVKGMPQLEELQNDLLRVDRDKEFEKSLIKFLKKKKRTLVYNGSKE